MMSNNAKLVKLIHWLEDEIARARQQNANSIYINFLNDKLEEARRKVGLLIPHEFRRMIGFQGMLGAAFPQHKDGHAIVRCLQPTGKIFRGLRDFLDTFSGRPQEEEQLSNGDEFRTIQNFQAIVIKRKGNNLFTRFVDKEGNRQ